MNVEMKRKRTLYKEFAEMIDVCIFILKNFLLKKEKNKGAKIHAEGKCILVLDELIKFAGKKESEWGTSGIENAWTGMWIVNRYIIEIKLDKVIKIAEEEEMKRLESKAKKIKNYINFAAKRYKKCSKKELSIKKKRCKN